MFYVLAYSMNGLFCFQFKIFSHIPTKQTFVVIINYDIGDDVPFRLTGKTSANMASYTEGYFFQFVDEMATSLDYNNDVKVFLNDEADANNEITSGFVVDPQTAGGHNFTVTFDNLQGVTTKGGTAVKGGDTIIVLFSAKLNENAEIGVPGQINKSRIVYSNNPYTKDKGQTPWEIVIVFTFEVDVNKVEEIDGQQVPRDQAKFELLKFDADKNDWVSLGEQGGDTTTKFVWSGIDAGKYKLVEVEPPKGYNKIDDIEFTVVGVYDQQDPPALTDLLVYDKNGNQMDPKTGFSAHYANGAYTGDGIVEATIINESGIELPETGGMGTTLFYIIGALLALGAGVVLVTRRRMQK